LTVDKRVKIEHVFVRDEIAEHETFREGSSPPDFTDKVALVNAEVAALAGTTDNRPKPIAETATSAMRLSLFFVDISVLSFQSRSRTFLASAL
jgi:hypothetical protein